MSANKSYYADSKVLTIKYATNWPYTNKALKSVANTLTEDTAIELDLISMPYPKTITCVIL